ncbi:MAG: hypothetical protein HRU29_01955 [Rhizobiales bacterium]|nr:hypothetical protein [Hyphomicrobiales bacterium]NRB13140.1 hypothetical protein [Hyphomicrobiales bacterium]
MSFEQFAKTTGVNIVESCHLGAAAMCDASASASANTSDNATALGAKCYATSNLVAKRPNHLATQLQTHLKFQNLFARGEIAEQIRVAQYKFEGQTA